MAGTRSTCTLIEEDGLGSARMDHGFLLQCVRERVAEVGT